MRALVVYCHPLETSLTHAVKETAVRGLVARGHEVRLLDLYAEGFDPVLSAVERRSYNEKTRDDSMIEPYVAQIEWAEILVLVFPTWWYGLPAMLKGWLDRVWLPHRAFTLPEGDQPIRGLMTNIRVLVGLTSYGSPWWWIKFLGDPGRRALTRGIRPILNRRCETRWLAHYRMDASTRETRAAHLARVERLIARL